MHLVFSNCAMSNSFNFWLQCASAVDNLAAFYFNNITMGEAPNLPASVNLARHIAECPNLFPEVYIFLILLCTSQLNIHNFSSKVFYKIMSVIWKNSVVRNVNMSPFYSNLHINSVQTFKSWNRSYMTDLYFCVHGIF